MMDHSGGACYLGYPILRREEAMAVDVVVPSLGDGITHGTLIRWLKAPGDRVEVDEPLFEISADKVDAEVPAPTSGTLLEHVCHPGDEVRVGSLVARIGPRSEFDRLAPPILRPSHSLAGQSLLGATLHSNPPAFLDDIDDSPLTASMPARSRIAVVAESARDEPLVEVAIGELERLGVGYERHRLRIGNPIRLREFARSAADRAVRAVVLCGGAGSHLATVVAAETNLPVVAVPREDEAQGLAGILGATHVPSGLPVVSAGPGDRGARQAVCFVARFLAAFDPRMAATLAGENDNPSGGFSGELF